MQSNSVKHDSLERRLILPDFGRHDRKIESYVSNRLLPAESLNVKDFDDSMLLSDIHLEKALQNNQQFKNEKDDGYDFDPTSYQEFEDSLTKSYNQKVKEDTNFLAKQKNLEYDSDEPSRNFGGRNNSDAYNLNTRKSYAQMAQQQSYQTNHKKSYELDLYEPNEFVPLEYQDSDTENFHLLNQDENETHLAQKIIQKVNSVGGIRKLYYIFKQQRREVLQKEQNLFTKHYQDICNSFIYQLEQQREKNLEFVLKKLNDYPLQNFTKQLSKIDQDYHELIGLGRKAKIPQTLQLEQAKELKLKMQERVMELWNLYQSSLKNDYDMERLLAILECYAEDELYFQNDLEIEQIEKLISREHHNSINSRLSQQQKSFQEPSSIQSQNDQPNYLQVQQLLGQISPNQKDSVNRMSVKQAVRMSIFTIAEEEDSQDEL
eukprot:403373014